MIAELFYPKELKQDIADLRAQDDLNEEAVKSLKDTPKVFLTIWIMAMLVLGLILYPDFLKIAGAGIGLSVVAITLIWMEIRNYSNRMMVYLRGEYERGVVQEIYTRAATSAPIAHITIFNSSSGRKEVIGPFIKWHKREFCPQKGEEIYYYSTGHKRRENMPDRIEIKKQYCLSRRILEGKNHD